MPLINWLTRDDDIKRASRAPYRLLEEISELSYGAPDVGNMLIQGDNLDALKALLPYYAGTVKCIYIDPPYNTGAAFEHYDDNVEHAKWLSIIYPRIELLREFLSEEGSIWISIDNGQGHYLKVLMDEIFGRKCYITTCVWQQRTTRENRKVFSEDAEYIHVYAKNPAKFKLVRNKLTLTEAVRARYKNPDKDPRGPWQSISANAQDGHATKDQFYDYVAPNGKLHKLPPGRCWLYTKDKMDEEVLKNNIWFGKNGNGVPRIKKFLDEDSAGLVPETLWLAKEVGTNDLAKKEIVKLKLNETVFDTPKPELLISRVLNIATNKDEMVLDSFVGSGTTAAVAQKMGRRYIGIELGDHAVTHCVPRLRKVIDGEQGGISEAVGWKGGGGFRFYRLGDPVFDETGRVSPNIRFAKLAAHLWFAETGQPLVGEATEPFLGEYEGAAYYLLFNGVLGDKRPNSGNILTSRILAQLPPFEGPKVIFGEGCRMGSERLAQERITFRHIPYEISAR